MVAGDRNQNPSGRLCVSWRGSVLRHPGRGFLESHGGAVNQNSLHRDVRKLRILADSRGHGRSQPQNW